MPIIALIILGIIIWVVYSRIRKRVKASAYPAKLRSAVQKFIDAFPQPGWKRNTALGIFLQKLNALPTGEQREMYSDAYNQILAEIKEQDQRNMGSK